jgi:hypothetical protein
MTEKELALRLEAVCAKARCKHDLRTRLRSLLAGVVTVKRVN